MSHSGSHHSTEEEDPSEDMASSIRPLSSYPRASPAHSRSPSPAPAPAPPTAPIRRTARMSVPSPVRISLGPLPRETAPVRERTYHLSGDPYRPPTGGHARVTDKYLWDPRDTARSRAMQQGKSSRAAAKRLTMDTRELALEHERRLRILSNTHAYDRDNLAQFEHNLTKMDIGMGRLVPHVYKNSQDNMATKKTADQALDLSYCNTFLIILIFVVLAFLAFGRIGH